MKVKRVRDWEKRFHSFVEKSFSEPFSYGTFDCGIMASDCIEAITGESFKGEYVYDSEYTLIKFMKKNGIDGLQDIPSRHGLKETNPNLMQRGDIAVGVVYEQETFLVNLGDKYLIRGERGCESIMKNEVQILKAWRVG